MNDQELLTLAAKAAGYKLSFYNGYAVNVTDFHPAQNVHGAKQWNPLTDDGDALRLAVKLCLWVHMGTYHVAIESYAIEEIVNLNDRYAATRRAIVRAAAAIGKEQP